MNYEKMIEYWNKELRKEQASAKLALKNKEYTNEVCHMGKEIAIMSFLIYLHELNDFTVP